jgi:hypothetical protein
MAIPAELMAERAAAWAKSDAAVRAMIVYGSLAQGSAEDKAGVAARLRSDLASWEPPGRAAHHGLDAADIDRVHRAAPASADPAELRRSLRATAELYAWALDRWSRRTGQPVPRNPLTPAITDKLHVDDQ